MPEPSRSRCRRKRRRRRIRPAQGGRRPGGAAGLTSRGDTVAPMPELPEVEAWVRELDPLVSAAPVLKAGPAHIATLKTFDPLRELEGRRFGGLAGAASGCSFLRTTASSSSGSI